MVLAVTATLGLDVTRDTNVIQVVCRDRGLVHLSRSRVSDLRGYVVHGLGGLIPAEDAFDNLSTVGDKDLLRDLGEVP